MCVWMYVCVYVSMYVCMYACMYLCKYSTEMPVKMCKPGTDVRTAAARSAFRWAISKGSTTTADTSGSCTALGRCEDVLFSQLGTVGCGNGVVEEAEEVEAESFVRSR